MALGHTGINIVWLSIIRATPRTSATPLCPTPQLCIATMESRSFSWGKDQIGACTLLILIREVESKGTECSHSLFQEHILYSGLVQCRSMESNCKRYTSESCLAMSIALWSLDYSWLQQSPNCTQCAQLNGACNWHTIRQSHIE